VGAPLARRIYCTPKNLEKKEDFFLVGGGGANEFCGKMRPSSFKFAPLNYPNISTLVKFEPFFDLRTLHPALSTALAQSS
jgi:hypothetical protein